jgi:hypothetical protein
LEETTRIFLAPKSTPLSPELGSFSELDPGEFSLFDFNLDVFGNNDVFCLSLLASPSYMTEEFETEAYINPLRTNSSDLDSNLSKDKLEITFYQVSSHKLL